MIRNFSTQPIFVSTNCLSTQESITSRIYKYQDHNLNCIELGFGVSVTEDDISEVSDIDCLFVIHNYFPPPRDAFVLNLASGDEHVRQRSLDLVSEAVELASRIGALFYSVHAGFITDPTSYDRTGFVFPQSTSPNETHSAMDRFITAMKIAVDHAEHCGIKVLVENNVCSRETRGKLLLQTAEEFLSLFSDLQSSHLGLLLDTGHLNVSAHTLGFDRMYFVDQLAPYVQAIHVHDNDGIADTHKPIQPNSWVIDVLRRPELAGLPLVVEAKFNDITELCQHVSWLKNEMERK